VTVISSDDSQISITRNPSSPNMFSQAVTVTHGQGPSSVAAVTAADGGTAPVLNLGFSNTPHSPLEPEEPENTRIMMYRRYPRC